MASQLVRLGHCIGVERRTFLAGGLTAEVEVQTVEFPIYAGPSPRSTWRKPVVGSPDCPFAELLVAADLRAAGWDAAWVYKPGQFLSSWEPRRRAELPSEAWQLHQAIVDEIKGRGGARAGCWDVLAWRAARALFVELKWAGSSDRLRAPQLRWREAALALDRREISDASFLVAEWTGGCVG